MLKCECLGLSLHPHDAGRSQNEEIQRLGSAVIIKVSFISEVHPVTSRKRPLLTTQNRRLSCSCPLSYYPEQMLALLLSPELHRAD